MRQLHQKMQTNDLTDEDKAIWEKTRTTITEHITNSNLADLYEVRKPAGPIPQKARILTSLICDKCRESVMETRTRRLQEQTLCIPCFEDLEIRF